MRLRAVLEGGGMCGLYQIGVLKELRKRELAGEFQVEAMSGASIGSYLAFCYYNDSLDLAAETLAKAKRTFKESPGAPYAGVGFCDAIREQITGCDDTVFDIIKDDCIYSSRTDIGTITNKIDSKYELREDLADAIICSMHVPYVTGSGWHCTSRDGRRYVDGVFPFIFRDRTDTDYRVLYVCNSAFAHPKGTVSGRRCDRTRIQEGHVDAKAFFETGVAGSFCSYVHTWSQFDFFVLRLKQAFAWTVRSALFVLATVVYGVLAPIKLLASTVLDDVFLHLVFGDFEGGSFVHDIGVAAVTGCAIASSVTIDVMTELTGCLGEGVGCFIAME